MRGEDGADLLLGEAGNDTLNGGAGADNMFGGLGNDLYILDDAGDSATEFVNEGSDTVRSALESYKIGSEFEDLELNGTTSSTGFVTGEGNKNSNVITASDAISSWLIGGDGRDTLLGGVQNDTLEGGDDDDSLSGGASDDDLRGGAGSDNLDGGIGADTMTGGGGNDTYFVDDENDLVIENADGGIDLVRTSATNWTISDNIESIEIVSNGAPQTQRTVTGSTGDDFVQTSIDSAVVFDGNGGSDYFDAGSGDDALSGGDGVDYLYGRNGDDTLMGGADYDELYGGDGNDSLSGGAGYGVIQGDAGDDTLESGDDGSDMRGGAGADLMTAGDGNNYLDGGDGDDTLNSGTGGGTFYGRDGDDVITGAGGNYRAYGGAGNDTLTTGSGNDYLDGEEGSDVMLGGAGDDVYIVDHAFESIIEVQGGGTDDAWVYLAEFTLRQHVENLYFYQPTTGETQVTGIGNESDNYIYMTSGLAASFAGLGGNDSLDGDDKSDTLDGGEGDDVIYGYDDNDLLLGGAGNDYIEGGSGEDTIIGGAGSDTLWGWTSVDGEADYFEYNAFSDSRSGVGNHDQLGDFEVGMDQIHLFDIGAVGVRVDLDLGDGTPDLYRISGPATGEADVILFVEQEFSNTYIRAADAEVYFGTGPGDPTLDTDFEIRINGLYDLTAVDFGLA